jgi:TusA-related sulfurtransferase/uncharacterized OsmC-like protein
MADESVPQPHAVCDGGDLDCGSGLLLIIRTALEPLPPGGVLEVKSREASVKEDLPAWCRMVGHALVATHSEDERTTRYFVRKKTADAALAADLERARTFRWRVRAASSGAMQARVFARNHTFVVGQPASFDAADAAPSAVELLLGALGGDLCAGFTWRASQRGVEVRRIEVSLEARADNPLVFLGIEERGHAGLAEVRGTLYLDAEVDDSAAAELMTEALARSPVAQSLLRRVDLAFEARRSS